MVQRSPATATAGKSRRSGWCGGTCRRHTAHPAPIPGHTNGGPHLIDAEGIGCQLILDRQGDRHARFTVCRWITTDAKAELERFIEAQRGDIARDLDGDPVFLAPHEFGLNYEADRWKDVRFAAIKDYQVREAA